MAAPPTNGGDAVERFEGEFSINAMERRDAMSQMRRAEMILHMHTARHYFELRFGNSCKSYKFGRVRRMGKWSPEKEYSTFNMDCELLDRSAKFTVKAKLASDRGCFLFQSLRYFQSPPTAEINRNPKVKRAKVPSGKPVVVRPLRAKENSMKTFMDRQKVEGDRKSTLDGLPRSVKVIEQTPVTSKAIEKLTSSRGERPRWRHGYPIAVDRTSPSHTSPSATTRHVSGDHGMAESGNASTLKRSLNRKKAGGDMCSPTKSRRVKGNAVRSLQKEFQPKSSRHSSSTKRDIDQRYPNVDNDNILNDVGDVIPTSMQNTTLPRTSSPQDEGSLRSASLIQDAFRGRGSFEELLSTVDFGGVVSSDRKEDKEEVRDVKAGRVKVKKIAPEAPRKLARANDTRRKGTKPVGKLKLPVSKRAEVSKSNRSFVRTDESSKPTSWKEERSNLENFEGGEQRSSGEGDQPPASSKSTFVTPVTESVALERRVERLKFDFEKIKDPMTTSGTPLGFTNLGNSCYMNSVLQPLLSVGMFSRGIEHAISSIVTGNGRNDEPPPLLSALFLLKEQINKKNSDLTAVLRGVKSAIGNERFSGNRQEDADEFLVSLLTQVQEECKKSASCSSLEDPTSASFGFQLSRTYICNGCLREMVRYEDNLVLSLSLPSSDDGQECEIFERSDELDLHDLLMRRFQKEKVDITCSSCRATTSDAIDSVVRLPKCLIVVLKRYAYNTRTKQFSKRDDVLVPNRILYLEDEKTVTEVVGVSPVKRSSGASRRRNILNEAIEVAGIVDERNTEAEAPQPNGAVCRGEVVAETQPDELAGAADLTGRKSRKGKITGGGPKRKGRGKPKNAKLKAEISSAVNTVSSEAPPVVAEDGFEKCGDTEFPNMDEVPERMETEEAVAGERRTSARGESLAAVQDSGKVEVKVGKEQKDVQMTNEDSNEVLIDGKPATESSSAGSLNSEPEADTCQPKVETEGAAVAADEAPPSTSNARAPAASSAPKGVPFNFEESVAVLAVTKWKEDRRVVFRLPSNDFKYRACQLFAIDKSVIKFSDSNSLSALSKNASVYDPPLRAGTVVGDGNCLFRSVSCSITGGNEDYHGVIRQKVVEFERFWSERFRSLTGKTTSEWWKYLDAMEKDGVWGTDVELDALASMLSANIYTFYNNSWQKFRPRFFVHEGNEFGPDSELFQHRKLDGLYLWNDNFHYDPVLDLPGEPLAKTYHLTAVVNHRGTTSSCGHYTCDIYNHRKCSWSHCDDEHIGKVSEKDVLEGCRRSGYIFIYSSEDALSLT